MKTLWSLFLTLIITFASFNLMADDEVIVDEPLPQAVVLSTGQNYYLKLEKFFYIERLIVSGEGIAQEAMIEVLVDGKVKGTIYFPGRDPDYVVTIREVAKTIEFRHLNGGRAKISAVKVFRSIEGYETMPSQNGPGKFYLMSFSNHLINLTRVIEEKIPTKDFEKNILPTKIAAGNLYAVSSARGDVSIKSMEKYQALYFTMGLSIPYIDTLLTQSATFDLALRYLSLFEEIKDHLDQ